MTTTTKTMKIKQAGGALKQKGGALKVKGGEKIAAFKEQLDEQRWDDHRYYHHSTINQSLHFLSASTFIGAYILLFHDPALASLLGWCVAMTSRQAGHFFFEPKTYDEVNQATHQHKEEIKIGYNLVRKVVFMSIWALMPLLLLVSPTLWGLFASIPGPMGFLRHVGLMWLALGIGGLLFRTVQLFFVHDVPTGIVWATKIVTDPFNDFKQYRHAPVRLLKGERLDTQIATR
ncbi:MAG TPA: hypothetical protein VNT42_01045 [Sphingomonas sp.]|nr:hypothetical protein [Sphingomonas sp.]